MPEESTSLSTTITEAAAAPKSVKGDEAEVQAHSLPDLIAADEYLENKAAAGRAKSPIRLTKISPGAW